MYGYQSWTVKKAEHYVEGSKGMTLQKLNRFRWATLKMRGAAGVFKTRGHL